MKHHWKNRINDIVLCIIVPIDSKYGSGKYRRLGCQTLKKDPLEEPDDPLSNEFKMLDFMPKDERDGKKEAEKGGLSLVKCKKFKDDKNSRGESRDQ